MQYGEWTKQDLLDVANAQQNMAWMILIMLLGSLVPFATIFAGIILLKFAYKLAVAVRSSAAWVYVVLAFVPIVGLVGLIVINVKATNILQRHGIRGGGFMGPRMEDFDNLS